MMENGCYVLPLFFLLFPFISQFVSILGHPYLGVKHVVRRLSLVSKDRAIGLFIFAEVIKSWGTEGDEAELDWNIVYPYWDVI